MGYGADKASSIQQELQTLMPRLHYFAAALTGSRASALDLTATICQTALARAARDKGQTPLLLWTLTEMHTLWVQRLAARSGPRRGEPAEPELFFPAAPRGRPSAATASLAKFIAHLPPQQRGALTLVYGLGLSYDEAAEVYGAPVSTLMTRLARCHKALSRWMEHRGAPGQDERGASSTRNAHLYYEEQAA
ncbi:MAG: RNA polymerase sigma factor [Hyphomicrobiales bacterium]|nr:RNA polymerase sigma factor [Hyphomicrobiales bacterium]